MNRSKTTNASIRAEYKKQEKKEVVRRKYRKGELTPECLAVADLKSTGPPTQQRLARRLQLATATKINTAVEMLKSGITPLGVMWEMATGVRDFDPDVFEICKAVAPYVHPRLSAVALQTSGDHKTHEEALRELDRNIGSKTALVKIIEDDLNEATEVESVEEDD